MIDSLTYTEVPGTKSSPKLTVFALSTCGFCKRAMTFLENNGFSYRFIHIDKLTLDDKNAVKRELKERFKDDVAFPFTMVGENDHLVGFIEIDWRKTLGIA